MTAAKVARGGQGARTAPGKGGKAANAAHAELPREVRIIGGAWKRSKLPVANRPGLRPTPDRVRETVFNWLGQSLVGWRCLDAFAGSGALGFEAASRGAAEVVLLERDPALLSSLAASKARLHAETLRIERADAVQWMARAAAESFELVFLDPPFDSKLLAPALAAAARLITPHGFVYVESGTASDTRSWEPGWQLFRSARAGAVHFNLLRRATSEPDPFGSVGRP
ncbi:MAG: 16S rRNA (guanine(966)-N(2))-methyltransferase RsmD [Caldimonas sp.]